MTDQSDWVARQAKLFEAGDYPDKGITVQEGDLDRLVAGFDGPVRIEVEHQEQPLELGFVERIWRKGRELMGLVRLSPEANALVEKSDARKLSVAITRALDKIVEVSLVRTPRVADARLFSDAVRFCAELCSPDETASRERDLEVRLREAEQREVSAREVARAAAAAMRETSVAAKLLELKRSGRLAPAAEGHARALLMTDDTIRFGDDQTPVAEVFERFLRAQPAMKLFGEMAPAASDHRPGDLTSDEIEFFRKRFPGLDLDELSKHRR